jgi:hypothetical protein
MDLGITGGTSINLAVSIGGKGGAGGYGGSVTVNNTGLIETYGDESHGILAQSIGGGGGAGGGSLAGTVTLFADNTINLTVAIGGGGGDGNHGGNVLINNHGEIYTWGGGAFGIFAQSIGGGGGSGGSARAITLSQGAEDSISLSLAIGGNGGAPAMVATLPSTTLATSPLTAVKLTASSPKASVVAGASAATPIKAWVFQPMVSAPNSPTICTEFLKI